MAPMVMTRDVSQLEMSALYVEMSQMSCEDPYDTTFTFNSLQDSGVYPNE